LNKLINQQKTQEQELQRLEAQLRISELDLIDSAATDDSDPAHQATAGATQGQGPQESTRTTLLKPGGQLAISEPSSLLMLLYP